jgi:hypothetical protein
VAEQKVSCSNVCACLFIRGRQPHTAILIISEGQFQVLQRFSSSKLVLKTVETCFTTFNYYENGSTFMIFCVFECMCVIGRICINK